MLDTVTERWMYPRDVAVALREIYDALCLDETESLSEASWRRCDATISQIESIYGRDDPALVHVRWSVETETPEDGYPRFKAGTEAAL